MRKQHKQETWPISTQKVTIPGRSRHETGQMAGSAQCACATAHLCQWPCSLATPRYSQMDHRTEGMDIVTGGWRKDPPKIISKHSEWMWWRIYIYLASWTKRRIPFPNDFGVISFSKQFKSPCGCRWRLPSGTQWWQKYQLLHSTSPESTGQRESVFPLAKAQSKGSVEGSPWFRFIWPKDFKENDCSLVYAFGWVPRLGLRKVICPGVQILPARCLVSLSIHGLSEDREGKGRATVVHKFPLHLVPKDFSQSLSDQSPATVNDQSLASQTCRKFALRFMTQIQSILALGFVLNLILIL